MHNFCLNIQAWAILIKYILQHENDSYFIKGCLGWDREERTAMEQLKKLTKKKAIVVRAQSLIDNRNRKYTIES